MPVLVIAVVFFAIFLVMGVMAITAAVAEHRGHLFSGRWSDEPSPVNSDRAMSQGSELPVKAGVKN